MAEELIGNWKKKSSKAVYDNPWIHVREDQVINPGGGNGIYGVVHFKNLAIGILPIDHAGNIWLVGQHRYPQNKYSWEIPEGGGKLEIDPLVSAKRELLEEVGLEANEWITFLKMDLSNSVSDEEAIVYVARNLVQKAPEPEESEDLVVKKIPFETAYQMVLNGEITDAISVATLLKAKIEIFS